MAQEAVRGHSAVANWLTILATQLLPGSIDPVVRVSTHCPAAVANRAARCAEGRICDMNFIRTIVPLRRDEASQLHCARTSIASHNTSQVSKGDRSYISCIGLLYPV